ncbi:MAG: MmgE/PrpD family protein [Proteobacteria bacterium]|nr:MmgE/PrpD family protein [Pseudomonadota bacterium]
MPTERLTQRLTQRLAEFVAGQSTNDIPDDVYDAARDAVIDTLGVALAGSREPVADIAASWVSEICPQSNGQSGATLWGRQLTGHSAEAALANGISAHALDFDDSLPSGRGHISACLAPTVLTFGETSGASGQDVLAAYAIGLEIAGILGRVFGPGHQRRGFHPTATVGALAATAAAARLSGLDAEGVARAWGLAGSQVSGLARNFGTMAKSFHVGRAAQTAIVSAGLAQKGFTADTAIFEGDGGVIDIFCGGDGEPIEAVFASLCEPWAIVSPGNCVKRWPCCYSGHRTIAALFELIEQNNIKADDVSDVSIGFLPGGDASLLSTDPQTGLEGKFSIEYIVAALLLDGALKMATFTDAMVQRPAARKIMQRVRRIHIPDEKFYSGIAGYNDISVTTRSGRFEVREDRVPGSRAWPMSDAERDDKFKDCAGLALGASGAANLLDQLKSIRSASTIQALVKATIPMA